MKIGISLLSLRPGLVGGSETYVRRLLEELPRVAGGEGLGVVLDRELDRTLETPGFERVVLDQSARAVVAERVLEAFTPWRSRAAERAFEELAADVVLFPQNTIFPKRAAGRAVVTLADLQHVVMPANFSFSERAFRAAIYGWSVRRADRVIAISEATRRMLVATWGVPAWKVVTIHHGYKPSAGWQRAPSRVAPPYLYYPAATFPHKNHAQLIRSYAALRRRGDLVAKLVFTGLKTSRWHRLRRLANHLEIGADVIHLGFVPYDEVQEVLAGAEAVVFPTLFEGFGLPVLEAVAAGKKIVTSRLEVFDEMGVPGEDQIDFRDPDALLAALRRPGATVLSKTPLLWAECAARTLALLREVAAAPLGNQCSDPTGT